MKTVRLYWKNTYLFKTAAQIIYIGEADGQKFLRLNQTNFYPQGGGQAADEGTIDGIKVTKLVDHRDIDTIDHYVEDASQFSVGQVVALEIDQARRLLNASLHTAGHITAGILRTQYGYKQQLGANHLSAKEASVTFSQDGSTVNKDSLKAQALQVIAEARSVRELEDENGVRLVAIDQLWTEPCCGTHVHLTSEVGDFDIRKTEYDKKKNALKVGYSSGYHDIGLFAPKKSEEAAVASETNTEAPTA